MSDTPALITAIIFAHRTASDLELRGMYCLQIEMLKWMKWGGVRLAMYDN